MSQHTIAPCPFCGNAANSRLDAITDVDAWVYCDACSACGPTKPTEVEAIDSWNATARLREALALAAEALEDYGQHTARCSWDGRMDAESVCDCGLEEAQRAARAALKGTPDA